MTRGRIALAGLALAMSAAWTTAEAQVQTPGPFGSLTGFYGFRGGSDTELFTGGGGVGAQKPGRTLEGILHGGYRFGDFDVALGLTGGMLSQRTLTAGASTLTQDARFFAIDLEGGYDAAFGAVGLRPFIGLRYANWKHRHAAPVRGPGVPASADIDTWGIGPRLGVDGAVRLSEMVSVFAGGSGSVLFGRLDEFGTMTPAVFPPPNGSTRRTMFNLDAKLGVAFEPIPRLSIAAGYRAEYWNGVTLTSLTTFAAGGLGAGRGNRFSHGPFVRVAWNFGAPVAAEAAPSPSMTVNGTSYMVFFDFDSATITPTASATIKAFATAAKAGQKTRIGVSGHADRSGSDAYNMALSLRRANAVKDQLVREGIPAATIVITGRGESQPLVQTADGVREPQNRRVEIVMN